MPQHSHEDTAEHAHALGMAMQIAEHWRGLGYDAEVRVIWAPGAWTVPGSWVIRSNMIGGRPTKRVKPPARPDAASSPDGGRPAGGGR